jgi:hypothetical protein
MDRDKPLLTLAQMDSWVSRVTQLDELISAQTEERAALVRKIEAARAYAELLGLDQDDSMDEADDIGDPTESVPESEESAAREILAAVGSLKGTPRGTVIRRWIKENNAALDARLTAHPQYLYTALARHVRRGRLVKRGKGYRLPGVSPKRGTGGPVTPSGLNGQTPNDTRAAETAPEAGGT